MKKNHLIFFLLLFIFQNNCYSQNPSFRRIPKKVSSLGSIGVSVGPEAFIGMPKASYLGEFSLSNARTPRFGFSRFAVYGGPEISIFGLFALVGSAGVNAGFAIGPLTIDNSVSYTFVLGENHNHSFSTYNPKVGINVGPIWLKAGPSIALSGRSDFSDMFDYKGTSYNIELLYIARIE